MGLEPVKSLGGEGSGEFQVAFHKELGANSLE